MQFNLMDAIETIGDLWYFCVTAIYPPFLGLDHFDHGLRKFLNPDFDFPRFGQELLEKTPPETFLLVMDELECQYVLFSLPDEPGRAWLCGPMRRCEMSEGLRQKILTQYGEKALEVISYYYQQITTDDKPQLLHTITRLCQRAYSETKFRYANVRDFFPISLDIREVSLLGEQKLELLQEKHRQERNRLEGQIVAAISQGDSRTALKALGDLQQNLSVISQTKNHEALRNQLLSANALCRLGADYSRSAQLEQIEQVYNSYLKKGESVADRQELNRLTFQMVTDYHECVQAYAAGQYSPPVQQMIQYIHMHMEENLSLKFFSQQYSFSPSYLSHLFHKETGSTLTDYINQYRVRRAAVLLRYTSLSVSQVGEQVGFLDENYFTRVFKRVKGVPPSAYRRRDDLPEAE